MRIHASVRPLLLALALLGLPASAWAGIPLAHDPTGDEINIGAMLEPIYDISIPEEGDTTGGFGLHRARLDVGGSVASQRVQYRLHLELTRPNQPILDAYLETRLGSGNTRLRVGRDKIQHHWQWSIHPSRLTFTQRALTATQLGYEGGRDTGLFLRGGTAARRWHLSLVDGNNSLTSADRDFGFVLGGRYSYALLGSAIDRESNPSGADIPFASVGIGFLAGIQQTSAAGMEAPAIEIEVGEEGLEIDENGEFNYGSLFVDLRLQFKAISITLDGAFRLLDTGIDDDDLRLGLAANALVGYVVVPDAWEVAGRFGFANPDTSIDDNGRLNFGGRLTRFHDQHRWKSAVEYNGYQRDEALDHLIRLVMTWNY